MKKLNLNEDFICRIWEDGTFYSGLKTCDNEDVEVIEFGNKNRDAGPDYKNARIKINDIVYSGSIEVHRSIKDWYLHSHKGDNKYNGLILHVVFYDNDHGEEFHTPVVKKSRSVPTVVLSDFLTKSVHSIWKEIINNPSPAFRLPCYPGNKSVPHTVKTSWMNELAIQRLNDKTQKFKSRLEEISSEVNKKIYWEQMLFESVCEALGYSKNKDQFLRMSKNVELAVIKNHDFNRFELDSLIFGLSGFLSDLRFKDLYIDELKSNWTRQRPIFKKEIMSKSEWNFFRLRPPNFPTLRLAYASALLFELVNNNFFKTLVKTVEDSPDVSKDLHRLFTEIKISEYWHTHNNFGRETKSVAHSIGSERVTDIISNVVIPVIYFYSLNFCKGNLKSKVEHFYKNLKQKKGGNEIIRVMEKQLDVTVRTLSDEQALIELHNFYCISGKCNQCEIGKLVFVNEEVHEPLKIILY